MSGALGSAAREHDLKLPVILPVACLPKISRHQLSLRVFHLNVFTDDSDRELMEIQYPLY